MHFRAGTKNPLQNYQNERHEKKIIVTALMLPKSTKRIRKSVAKIEPEILVYVQGISYVKHKKVKR